MSDERIHEDEIAEEIEAMEEDAETVETMDDELAAVSAELDELLNGDLDGPSSAEVAVDPSVLPELPPLRATAPRLTVPAVITTPPAAQVATEPLPDRPDITVQLPDPRRVTDYLRTNVGAGSERTWFAILAAVAVMLDGFLGMGGAPDPFVTVIVAIGLGVIVYTEERRLLISFVVASLTALAQLTSASSFSLLDLAAAIVFYRIARYGAPLARKAMLVVGAPLASFFMSGMIGNSYGHLASAAAFQAIFGWSSGNILFVISLIVFGSAWFMGNTARKADETSAALGVVEGERDSAAATAAAATATAVAAIEQRDAASEIARLKEEQAALAHDVHDVVGHSLAVVLAQAESAAFLPDDDVPALRQAISNIEGAARTALREVRQVLGSAQATDEGEVVGDPLDLIDSARSAGYGVLYAEYGTPVDLSTGVATVSYRVLQELLTNAIKHGTREEPIQVVRQFTDDSLIIRVVNRFDPQATATFGVGSGHEGIRHRLLRTGGHLDLTRTNDAPGVNRFIATAHIMM